MHAGETFDCENVVLAAGAATAARLIAPHAPGASAALEAIPYAAMAVVQLTFPLASLKPPLRGFGFLAPEAEGRGVLGDLRLVRSSRSARLKVRRW